MTSKIKEYILTKENLARLVELVNEEMDVSSNTYRNEMETVTNEIAGVLNQAGPSLLSQPFHIYILLE